MGNSMYDKNEIEDSLEFCRQIKEYEDISATCLLYTSDAADD